jgi:hypothetical protein
MRRTSEALDATTRQSRVREPQSTAWVRENGLSLAMAGLFVAALCGQIAAGMKECNDDRVEHGMAALRLADYVTSAHFLEAVFENWESEFLQMGMFVILTIFLRQKGSSESKQLEGREEVDEDPKRTRRGRDVPWPVRRGGWVLRLYEYSLSIALLSLFGLSFAMHAFGGHALHNEELTQHGRATLSFFEYLASSRFWFESFQNWQSEFLSVGVLIVLSIFLRQKGSPQSKRTSAPHHETGE